MIKIPPPKQKYLPASFHQLQEFYNAHGRQCQNCLQVEGAISEFTGKPVKLNRAHLDQNTKNNQESNLACWCTYCHGVYDQQYKKSHPDWDKSK